MNNHPIGHYNTGTVIHDQGPQVKALADALRPNYEILKACKWATPADSEVVQTCRNVSIAYIESLRNFLNPSARMWDDGRPPAYSHQERTYGLVVVSMCLTLSENTKAYAIASQLLRDDQTLTVETGNRSSYELTRESAGCSARAMVQHPLLR